MERYVSKDGCVAKYVHDDGSETSIKTWPEGMESCGGSGREKFNVFISTSVGCPVKCAFCYLTSKKFPYSDLTPLQVASNTLQAIEEEFKYRPNLKRVPMNLSFMGMGDAWLDLHKTQRVVSLIISWLDKQPIEGVDIATTLPRISWEDKGNLRKISKKLEESGRLVERPADRTPLRIFYSLFSVDHSVRSQFIPRSLSPDIAYEYLVELLKDYNVICHLLFLDGINDDILEDILPLTVIFSPFQLRLLRFNRCPNSIFQESNNIDYIIELLSETPDINFKYQLSPGSEVAASCGMFLMKDIK